MQPRLKSDFPLISEIAARIQSLSPSRKQEQEPAAHVVQSSTIPSTTLINQPTRPVSYELRPLSYVECTTDDISSGFKSDLGISLRRLSSPFNISIAVPSIMCLQPEQRSASASRKRLSDAGKNKPRWLTQLPMLTADHSITYNSNSNVQKLLLKANLDLNSSRYSGEATWFAKWEGQPAKLKFRWSESNPSTVLFDAQMAIRSSAHKIRLTGHPHQLHSASLILGPAKTQDDAPVLEPQPLIVTSSSSSSSSSSTTTRSSSRGRRGRPTAAACIDADSSTSGTSGQPVTKSFDQPGLQYELGWNLQQNSPVMSASRRFGSNAGNSSSWGLKQVKAAYDGKSSALSLSAAGGCWNFGMLFPTEASGPLGLPKLGQAGLWPKVLLTLTPDLALQ